MLVNDLHTNPLLAGRNKYVVYSLGTGYGEHYWTGNFTRFDTLEMTTRLDDAWHASNARLAYDTANRCAARCRALLSCYVGRRPIPFNLKTGK
jgi:hypothetical protein